MDLPTLNSILSEYDLTSNRQSKQFSLLYKSLTINQIIKMFESYFEYHLIEKLEVLSKKDKSSLSRELVTVVLDESVFKQWLSSFNLGKNYSSCFGSFFSGQTRSTVYGFKNSCIGIVIDGIYYPLYFDYVKKRKKTEDDKYSTTIKTAIDLINRFGEFKKRLKKAGINLEKLHFSADNGFSDSDLIKCAENNELIYIGVPKKSHLFEIEGVKIKLKEWIKTIFVPLEEKHNDAQKQLSKNEQVAFTYRFKGKYLSKNLSLTLLAFRLNGSKKVSIIYSPSKTIFAKTLRRHWFQRTYIEQFFKTMKHVLKIQESRTNDKDKFSFKFLRFAFMALHIQKLVRRLQKKLKKFSKKGFISIQRISRRDDILHDLLQTIILR